MSELQKVPMPEVMTRPETGPMQFEGDWPGIFIRGDNALYYAYCIQSLIDGDSDIIAKAAVKGLKKLLAQCEVATQPAPQEKERE